MVLLHSVVFDVYLYCRPKKQGIGFLASSKRNGYEKDFVVVASRID